MRIRRGSETILVVDDNPTILDLIEAILMPLGYTILDAKSAEEALMVMEKYSKSVDLLLTDVVMPEMKGSELAVLFQERYPNTKILFMSGYLSPAIPEEEMNCGMKGFLQKPLQPRELTNKLREMLD